MVVIYYSLTSGAWFMRANWESRDTLTLVSSPSKRIDLWQKSVNADSNKTKVYIRLCLFSR
jgi:hypothetical protein